MLDSNLVKSFSFTLGMFFGRNEGLGCKPMIFTYYAWPDGAARNTRRFGNETRSHENNEYLEHPHVRYL